MEPQEAYPTYAKNASSRIGKRRFSAWEAVSMMDVIAALHTIDDSTDHNGEINKNAAHAHKALRSGVQGTADEFTHGIAPVLAVQA